MQKQAANKPIKKESKAGKEEDESFFSTLDNFWKQYSSQTPTRVKIIDWFVVYLLALIGLQLFYRIIVGDDFPKNAFITGLFCPLGIIVLLLAIRNQGKDYRQLAQFFIASLVLFIVSINFMG